MVPEALDLNETGVGRLSREEMKTLINIEELLGTPVFNGQVGRMNLKREDMARDKGGKLRSVVIEVQDVT